jgi:type I restriction enzyme S subunit
MHLHAQGSTRFNLSKTTVKEKLNLFIPSKEKQKEIVSRLEKLLDLEMSLISKSSQVKNILHQIINNVIN